MTYKTFTTTRRDSESSVKAVWVELSRDERAWHYIPQLNSNWATNYLRNARNQTSMDFFKFNRILCKVAKY